MILKNKSKENENRIWESTYKRLGTVDQNISRSFKTQQLENKWHD